MKWFLFWVTVLNVLSVFLRVTPRQAKENFMTWARLFRKERAND